MTQLSFETAVTINAPIETVYNYIADLPSHVEWSYQPQAMTKLTSGPAGIGTQYRTEESLPSNMPVVQKIMMKFMLPMMKRKHNFEGHTIAEITDLAPNSRVAWTSHVPTKDGKKLMEMHWAIALEQQNGATKVTQSCRPDPPDDSPFKSAVNISQIKEEATGNLNRLKTLLESKEEIRV